MTVVLNGEERALGELEDGTDLGRVVAALGLKADRVAVELNGEIARRAAWGSTAVRSGDKLEVVHFVGGGSAPSGRGKSSMLCGTVIQSVGLNYT